MHTLARRTFETLHAKVLTCSPGRHSHSSALQMCFRALTGPGGNRRCSGCTENTVGAKVALGAPLIFRVPRSHTHSPPQVMTHPAYLTHYLSQCVQGTFN